VGSHDLIQGTVLVLLETGRTVTNFRERQGGKSQTSVRDREENHKLQWETVRKITNFSERQGGKSQTSVRDREENHKLR